MFSALTLQHGHGDATITFVTFVTFVTGKSVHELSLINPVFDAKALDGAVGVTAQYPFCCLSGLANILVVPARHSASISAKLMQEMAAATVIGPF